MKPESIQPLEGNTAQKHEEDAQSLSLQDVILALRENGITPVRVDSDGPESIEFYYDDYFYKIILTNPPFISFYFSLPLIPETHDLEILKDAAIYVSYRTSGACVFVLPDDYLLDIVYDYLVDSYDNLRKHLILVLENLFSICQYYLEYCFALESKKDKSSSE